MRLAWGISAYAPVTGAANEVPLNAPGMMHEERGPG
jgi:hypothetical protein